MTDAHNGGTSVIPPGMSQCVKCGTLHAAAACPLCIKQGYTVRPDRGF